MLAVLVAAGGRIGAASQGTTPLHAAARGGHRAVVQWLLPQGANAEARGSGGPWEGKTPLVLACENGHEEIALLLRRHGVCG
jgi:ankyrin repeat protein